MSNESPRIPPFNYEAEQSVLGSILMRPSLLDEALEVVKASDFHRPAHQKIYNAMIDLRLHGEAIDHLTVANFLSANKIIDECGGKLYLLELSGSVPTTENWKQYATIVHEKAQYRKLIELGGLLQGIGYEAPIGDIEDSIGFAMSAVTALALDSDRSTKTTSEILDDFMKDLHTGNREYITPKGVPNARMMKGDLVVAAAGTSVGKTAITLDWADEWSKTKKVTYFEYEMQEEQLLSRLICKHAKVPLQKIQDRDLSVDEIQRIEDASEEIKKRNLKVEEVWCNNQTLFAKIRREAQAGTDIVIIDHLGLVPFDRTGGMNEAKAVGVQVTNPLKRLASELGIIIVLLVQLNREGQRDAGFPRLYHLRDSGEIEQDASVVLTLWSERSIKDDWGRRVTLREKSGIVSQEENLSDDFYLFRVGVEKNRNGKLDESYALYRGDIFSFDFRDTQVYTYIDRKLINDEEGD